MRSKRKYNTTNKKKKKKNISDVRFELNRELCRYLRDGWNGGQLSRFRKKANKNNKIVRVNPSNINTENDNATTTNIRVISSNSNKENDNTSATITNITTDNVSTGMIGSNNNTNIASDISSNSNTTTTTSSSSSSSNINNIRLNNDSTNIVRLNTIPYQ